MNAISLRTLQLEDAPELLEFERDNRAWFEHHIASRGDAFYTIEGVHEHVMEYLDAHARSTWHPCVIVAETGAIVGRANLKDIDLAAGVAEIGYRMAQACVGKGLATGAVRHLVELARSQWKLERLVAYVGVENTASAGVLGKCGFRRGEWRTTTSPVRDEHQFVLDLR